ncbi:MAG TPA: DUF6452 family protein [Cyclobacteriaceae bacterium]|nr:DUF6452 family protein [Cyclobacteriaceae bacterium]
MRKIPVLLLFFVITSCFNQANCLITSTNLVKINLKKLTDSSVATVTFNSVTVPGTSLTFYNNVAATALNLPVDPAATATTFLFSYKETVNGVVTNKSSTLTLGYANESRIISEDCGAFQYHVDLSIMSTDFTKTKLINRSLLTTVTSNLEIYF